jgi:ABC-2 type transport system ATP-binding protein
MDVLVVSKLVKKFGSVKAVDKVSFKVKKGEIFGLLGVNGAGKSTTIDMLSGLTSPDSGTIKLFGKDFSKNQEECKQRFNVATAYYNLHGRLTVWQNLIVYAKLYNVKNPKDKIKDLSEKFMIKDLFKTKIQSLSSGERSRVVLVKSLLNDPELLFLDECTVGLDPDMAEITRDHLKQYNKETGCTIIFTSHYMQEVEKLCNRISFMNKGKIVSTGNAQDLVEELQTQKVMLHFSKNIKKAQSLLRKREIIFEQNGKQLIFHLQNKKRVVYPLLEEFIKQKIPFDDIHLEKPTLEDYFIRQSRQNESSEEL